MELPARESAGQWACQQETNGVDHVTVIDQLAAAGYSWDDANSIASAADTIYCPWNLSPSARGTPAPPPD